MALVPDGEGVIWQAFALATSFYHNPRNNESCWYGFWEPIIQHIGRSVGQNGYSFPVSQYRFYLEPTSPEQTANSSSSANEDEKDPEDYSSEPDHEENNEDVDYAGDISNVTTGSLPYSVHDDIPHRTPDFILIYPGTPPRTTIHTTAGFHWELLRCNWDSVVPMIMENKRAAPRWLRDNEEQFQRNTTELLSKAKDQSAIQAGFLFLDRRYARQNQVICVATSGSFWTYLQLNRASLPPSFVSNLRWPERAVVKLPWSEEFKWGTNDSNNAVLRVTALCQAIVA